MSVILLTGDLTVLSRVDGAAQRCGLAVRSYSGIAQALAQGHRGEAAELLIVDLAVPSLDLKELSDWLPQIAATRPRVVAFGPHVHTHRLTAARDAGCDEVLSRGEFFARLDAILQTQP